MTPAPSEPHASWSASKVLYTSLPSLSEMAVPVLPPKNMLTTRDLAEASKAGKHYVDNGDGTVTVASMRLAIGLVVPLPHDGQIADLATLIYYVAAIDGIDRIRFTTSHPMEMSDSLIQAYAEVPKLASYLHLPVQSGSDRILKRMNRGHTAEEYIRLIERILK